LYFLKFLNKHFFPHSLGSYHLQLLASKWQRADVTMQSRQRVRFVGDLATPWGQR
jgi:hypothetical protein